MKASRAFVFFISSVVLVSIFSGCSPASSTFGKPASPELSSKELSQAADCAGVGCGSSTASPSFWSSLWMNSRGGKNSQESVRDVLESSEGSAHRVELREVELLPPLSLEVLNDAVINGVLKISVRVTPKALIDPRDVVVEAVGLAEGQVLERESQGISDVLVGDILRPGKPIDLEFTLPSKDLGEYQVRCYWGELPPAKGRQGTARAKLDARKGLAFENDELFMIRDVAITSDPEICGFQPCDYHFTVEGKLVNYSKSDVSDINLALGIFWVEEGRETVYPKAFDSAAANEEIVSLGKFTLPAGLKKTVRLTVNRPIPDVPGGRFIPHLRILSGHFNLSH